MKKLVCVAGPTGSGKTALGIEIAKEFNGEIISADSMQIYRELNIGTAKPAREEMQGIPHHLIDIVEPDGEFSVKEFVDLANEKIDDITLRGKLPIVVGGTGLFISSLIDNVQFSDGEADEALRQELSEIAEKKGASYLHEMLKEIDYESYLRLHPNNVRRVIRAIEVYKTTGITMTEQIKNSKNIPPAFSLAYFGLNTDREIIYDRINKRVDIMMEKGLLEEVISLKEKGYSTRNKSMQAIGYKELLLHLSGKLTLDEAVDLIKQESRRYAKRQLTWFRRDERIKWIDIKECNTVLKQMNAVRECIKAL
ncbi:MAG: tRNA (adenosine(37)-N6)-dimethylallyltransferase MiaA [Ruminococcaceae bacterium]|nr:tRNA (adenosine(37)-N6)-dimethylallyltransferase MiaA [Oscillospiraceae bacterium]